MLLPLRPVDDGVIARLIGSGGRVRDLRERGVASIGGVGLEVGRSALPILAPTDGRSPWLRTRRKPPLRTTRKEYSRSSRCFRVRFPVRIEEAPIN